MRPTERTTRDHSLRPHPPTCRNHPYFNESAYLHGEAPEGLSPLVRLILMRRYGVYVFTDLYGPYYRSNYSSINELHHSGAFDTDLGRVSVLSNCGLTLSPESLAQALNASANEFACSQLSGPTNTGTAPAACSAATLICAP